VAKQRHRIFEIYEYRHEALRALMPNSQRAPTETTPTEEWTFKHFRVSKYEDVIHVHFEEGKVFGDEIADELRQDLDQLVERLGRYSKLLFDFEGVVSLSPSFVNLLTDFNKKLRNRGSRIVLCRIGDTARESFYGRP
jgi:hypothetical protein